MTEKPVQYLRLIGRLRADNRLDLRPGYLTTTPRYWQRDAEGPLRAEMLDGEGQVLLRQGVPSAPYCFGGGLTADLAVWADIAFPKDTRSVRFYRDGVLLHEIQVPRKGPKIRLAWSPKARMSGKDRIVWNASHPDEVPLQYIIRYSHDNGLIWRRIGRRTSETGAVVDFGRLPGGSHCRVQVVATDGANTATVRSRAFAVPEKGCAVAVRHPPDGSRFAEGDPIVLEGMGFHVERFEPIDDDLCWESDRDGHLGKGRILPVRKLSPGKHRITLRADSDKASARANVSIQVTKSKRRERNQAVA